MLSVLIGMQAKAESLDKLSEDGELLATLVLAYLVVLEPLEEVSEYVLIDL